MSVRGKMAALLRASRIRFSLLTLLLGCALLGSAVALARAWHPWRKIGDLSMDYTTSIRLSHDEKRYVATNSFGQVVIGSLDSTPTIVTQGHRKWSWYGEFSPDDKKVAAVSNNGEVKIFDAQTGTTLRVLKGRHVGTLWHCHFSQSGELLVTAGRDGACVWRVADGSVVADLRDKKWTPEATFSPDERRVFLSTTSNAVLWDIQEKRILKAWGPEVPDYASAALSHDGKTIAIVTANKTIELYDAGTLQLKTTIPNPEIETGRDIQTLSFSQDDRLLISEARSGLVQVWKESGLRVLKVPSTSQLPAAAISPDSRTLATQGANGDADLWDLESGLHLDTLPGAGLDNSPPQFDSTGRHLVCTKTVWENVRPARPYGQLYLPEFWITAFLGLMFLWSINRDRRALHS